MINFMTNIDDVSNEISESINKNSLSQLLILINGNTKVEKDNVKQDSVKGRKILLFSNEKNNNTLENEKKAHIKFMKKELNKLNEQISLLEEDNSSYKSNISAKSLKSKRLKLLKEMNDVEKLYSSKKNNLDELEKYDLKEKNNKEEFKISFLTKNYISMVMNKISSKQEININLLKMEIENAKDELSQPEFNDMCKEVTKKCKKNNIELPEEINNLLNKNLNKTQHKMF